MALMAAWGSRSGRPAAQAAAFRARARWKRFSTLNEARRIATPERVIAVREEPTVLAGATPQCDFSNTARAHPDSAQRPALQPVLAADVPAVGQCSVVEAAMEEL